jgi:hypothetical protein
MTTWIDVMNLAQALRAKRDSGQVLDAEDADRLSTMVLDFHRRAVVSTPTPDRRDEGPRSRPPR